MGVKSVKAVLLYINHSRAKERIHHITFNGLSLTAIMSDFPCIRKGKYRPAATSPVYGRHVQGQPWILKRGEWRALVKALSP